MADTTPESDVDGIVDAFMAFLENQGLVGAGEGSHTLEFVVHRDGTQAVESDRETVQAWSRQWADRATIDVGPLTDLNPAA